MSNRRCHCIYEPANIYVYNYLFIHVSIYKCKVFIFFITGMKQVGNVRQAELVLACLVYVQSWWPVVPEVVKEELGLVWVI